MTLEDYICIAAKDEDAMEQLAILIENWWNHERIVDFIKRIEQQCEDYDMLCDLHEWINAEMEKEE